MTSSQSWCYKELLLAWCKHLARCCGCCTLLQDALLQLRVQMWCVCPLQTALCLWSPLSSLPFSCSCCFLKDRATRPACDVEDLDVLPIHECHSSPFYITSAQIPAWAPRDSADELPCQETCLVDLHLCLLVSLLVRDPKVLSCFWHLSLWQQGTLLKTFWKCTCVLVSRPALFW